MSSVDAHLDELAGLRLTAVEWNAVHDELTAAGPGDDTEIARIVFEAKVRQRFHSGRTSSTLAPTKQTSALPWVGAACGLLLLAVGASLGGGAILVGVVALSLGVMAVAVAGSRVAHRQKSATDEPEPDPLVPMPTTVADVVATLRR